MLQATEEGFIERVHINDVRDYFVDLHLHECSQYAVRIFMLSMYLRMSYIKSKLRKALTAMCTR